MEFWVMDPDHSGARARGGNDIVVVLKSFEDLKRNRLRGGAIAGIVRRLSAAGLRTWDLDGTALIFEQFHSGKPDGWPE
jgi:hypothetical protein